MTFSLGILCGLLLGGPVAVLLLSVLSMPGYEARRRTEAALRLGLDAATRRETEHLRLIEDLRQRLREATLSLDSQKEFARALLESGIRLPDPAEDINPAPLN